METIIIEKMHELRLKGMRNAYQNLLETNQYQKLTNDEFLNLLIQGEWEDRQNRKTARLLSQARFRYKACIEEIDFVKERKIDKTQIIRLSDCSFVNKKENILITGPTGIGKSFIVSALGNQACLKGYKVLYYNMQKLISYLKISRADESYMKHINKIEKADLLILDDFGLQKLDTQARLMFMEIIEDRHDRKSTIISSQLPVSNWYDVIGESNIADAILDRMSCAAHRIEMNGPTMRKHQNKKESKQFVN